MKMDEDIPGKKGNFGGPKRIREPPGQAAREAGGSWRGCSDSLSRGAGAGGKVSVVTTPRYQLTYFIKTPNNREVEIWSMGIGNGNPRTSQRGEKNGRGGESSRQQEARGELIHDAWVSSNWKKRVSISGQASKKGHSNAPDYRRTGPGVKGVSWHRKKGGQGKFEK